MYVEATRHLAQVQILHGSQNYLNTFANRLVNTIVASRLTLSLRYFILSFLFHLRIVRISNLFIPFLRYFPFTISKGSVLYRTSRLDELSRIAYCVLYKSCRRFQKKYYTDAKEKRGFTGSAEMSEFTFA